MVNKDEYKNTINKYNNYFFSLVKCIFYFFLFWLPLYGEIKICIVVIF